MGLEIFSNLKKILSVSGIIFYYQGKVFFQRGGGIFFIHLCSNPSHSITKYILGTKFQNFLIEKIFLFFEVLCFLLRGEKYFFQKGIFLFHSNPIHPISFTNISSPIRAKFFFKFRKDILILFYFFIYWKNIFFLFVGIIFLSSSSIPFHSFLIFIPSFFYFFFLKIYFYKYFFYFVSRKIIFFFFLIHSISFFISFHL